MNDPAKSRRGVYIASIAYMNEKGHYTINNQGRTIYVPVYSLRTAIFTRCLVLSRLYDNGVRELV